jgi:hypothetical protein
MKVFIPIRTTERLNQNVEQSIEAQGGDIHLVYNEALSTLPRRVSEWLARDDIVDIAKGLSDEYVVTNDANAWHLYADNFKCMQKTLDENRKLGAVGLFRNKTGHDFKMPEINHVYLSSVMWRRKILAAMPELTGKCNPVSCCCHYYGEAVRAMGYKYEFVDALQRVKEIY